MSVSYWLIQGVGIDTAKIEPYLNRKSLMSLLSRELPGDEFVELMERCGDYNQLDINEFFYGEPFDNLGDLLCHCDKTDSITYGEDGDGGVYFYYPPSMPWHHTANEPKTLQEVHKRIVDAVKAVTVLSNEEIERMIDDDLYVVGVG